MTRKITPFSDLKALFRLYSYLKKEKPAIVHSHTPKAGLIGMMAARLAGVPYRLHTVAGLPLLETVGFKRKLLDFVEKITYACATKIYPNSKGLADIIIENNYCKEQKLKVIANGSSNGIDTDFFNPNFFTEDQKTVLRNELKIAQKDFVFVFVGRLVKDKGLNEMVKAFASLQQKYNHAKLLLVGDYENDLDPLLPETITAIIANNAIITVGFQYDVRPYLAISNALVFPSYREGFPNVVMQAGAMNLPSIVTDINGCNEIIEEGINGVIIPPKNTTAIFDAMSCFIEDSHCYHQLQNNARKMITSRYDQQVVWKAILKEYADLEQ